MAFNYGEFAIIKGRVIDFFPNPQEFECVTVAQPVGNEKVSVFGTQHVGKADIVLSIYLNDIYLGVFTVILVIGRYRFKILLLAAVFFV